MSGFVAIPSLNIEIGSALASDSEIASRRCFVWAENASGSDRVGIWNSASLTDSWKGRQRYHEKEMLL
jgi:hypothetical protein